MTTKADEQFHDAQHATDRVTVEDAWTTALRNELGLLEAHLAAAIERDRADLERRIGEVKHQLGRGGKQTATRKTVAAQERA